MAISPLALPGPRTRRDSTFRTATAAERSQCPTLIVSMPFMDAHGPSIQLGLLSAIGTLRGFPVTTLHANLDFAARIGIERYDSLAQHRGIQVGDWLFSVEAFGPDAPDPDDQLLEHFAHQLDLDDPAHSAEVRDSLVTTRSHDVPDYLDALVEDIAWGELRVVAFSSTFSQNAASFALARRLKAKFPDLVTIFGGANFDGEMGMELVRTVDVIDYAVIGEGDLAFPRLLDELAAGGEPGAVPGVAHRVDGHVVAVPPEPPFARLDELPIPDYEEYFRRAEKLGVIDGRAHRAVRIPFESSRGCWWGEKHHCTFCGLNGIGMAFRSKTPTRVLEELAEQSRRYRSFSFDAVDNIIDVGHLRTVLPALVQSRADYEIFYEVKANLTREQLKLMAQAGITRIQPGLESLNSRVLTLMRKGVRAGQNINLLRWAQYYGITVSWNILWGFPGESEEDYAEQAGLLPHVVHLQPPMSAGPIWMERFSPLYSDHDAFRMRSRSPERSYSYVYPSSTDLEKVAYFFDYELAEPLPDRAYAGVGQAVQDWRDAWTQDRRPVLRYWSAPGFLQIYDGRHVGSEGTYTFDGPIAEVYLGCTDRPITAAAVRERYSIDLSLADVEEVISEFAARGLMVVDGSSALSLAIPAVGGR